MPIVRPEITENMACEYAYACSKCGSTLTDLKPHYDTSNSLQTSSNSRPSGCNGFATNLFHVLSCGHVLCRQHIGPIPFHGQNQVPTVQCSLCPDSNQEPMYVKGYWFYGFGPGESHPAIPKSFRDGPMNMKEMNGLYENLLNFAHHWRKEALTLRKLISSPETYSGIQPDRLARNLDLPTPSSDFLHNWPPPVGFKIEPTYESGSQSLPSVNKRTLSEAFPQNLGIQETSRSKRMKAQMVPHSSTFDHSGTYTVRSAEIPGPASFSRRLAPTQSYFGSHEQELTSPLHAGHRGQVEGGPTNPIVILEHSEDTYADGNNDTSIPATIYLDGYDGEEESRPYQEAQSNSILENTTTDFKKDPAKPMRHPNIYASQAQLQGIPLHENASVPQLHTENLGINRHPAGTERSPLRHGGSIGPNLTPHQTVPNARCDYLKDHQPLGYKLHDIGAYEYHDTYGYGDDTVSESGYYPFDIDPISQAHNSYAYNGEPRNNRFYEYQDRHLLRPPAYNIPFIQTNHNVNEDPFVSSHNRFQAYGNSRSEFSHNRPEALEPRIIDVTDAFDRKRPPKSLMALRASDTRASKKRIPTLPPINPQVQAPSVQRSRGRPAPRGPGGAQQSSSSYAAKARNRGYKASKPAAKQKPMSRNTKHNEAARKAIHEEFNRMTKAPSGDEIGEEAMRKAFGMPQQRG